VPASPIATTPALRVGFVGTGDIAARHAEILRSIPEAVLVAVCDLALERAHAFGGRYGVPQVYPSAEEMLSSEHPDVVHVLTPPQAHASVTLQALRAGSHVLVEKPLATSVADGERLQRESVSASRLCGVNHTMTHLPVVDRLIDLIRGRRLGRVDHVSVMFSVPPAYVSGDADHYMFQRPANLLFEFAPHPFSLVHLLMGRLTHATCLASGERRLSDDGRYFSEWQIPLICERGTASVHLSIGRGVHAWRLHVLGQDGAADADLLRGTLCVDEAHPGRIAGPIGAACAHARETLSAAIGGIAHQYGLLLRRESSRRAEPFSRSITAFYRSILTGAPLREDVTAGQAVVEFCEAAASRVTTADEARSQGIHVLQP
jgi:predicted dehydrogenase